MRHPFQSLALERRKPVFFSLLGATFLALLVLSLVNQPLVTAPAPSGIVSFEIAGSVERAQAMIDSWDTAAQLRAAFSLGFDYLFMVFYAATTALGCVWAADVLRARGWPLAGLGGLLAWGVFGAAVFDGIENLALTRLLFGPVAAPWPQIALASALLKFALLTAGMIYAFLGLASHLFPAGAAGRRGQG